MNCRMNCDELSGFQSVDDITWGERLLVIGQAVK